MSSFNLAVLLSGYGSNLQAVLDAAAKGIIVNLNVALVISDRDNSYGLKRAKKRAIPHMKIEKSDKTGLLKTLEAYDINGIVLAGYLSILPPEVVKAYDNRIINIHPALLPLFGGMGFYGIKVHQAVLASGAPYSGATAHLVDCGVDTGAALVRGVVPVLTGDTAESLQKRVLEKEHDILIRAVKIISENKAGEMTKEPLLLVDDKDREGFLKYTEGIPELRDALTVAGNGGL